MELIISKFVKAVETCEICSSTVFVIIIIIIIIIIIKTVGQSCLFTESVYPFKKTSVW